MSWDQRYFKGFYYSIVTMITVGNFNLIGYGDILPISITEKIFSSAVIIISCIIFGYLLNSIG